MAEIATAEAEKLEQAAPTEIKTAEEFTAATELAVKVKTQLKNATDTRDKYILPMKRSVDDLDNELFQPTIKRLKGMKSTLDSAMVVYHNRLAAEAKAKEARIEKKVESGKMDMSTAINKTAKIDQAPTQAFAAGGEVRFTTHRTVKLKDFSKVPPWVFADPKVVAAMESVARSQALKEGVAGFEIIEEKRPSTYGG